MVEKKGLLDIYYNPEVEDERWMNEPKIIFWETKEQKFILTVLPFDKPLELQWRLILELKLFNNTLPQQYLLLLSIQN